jgi:hypothetical protein
MRGNRDWTSVLRMLHCRRASRRRPERRPTSRIEAPCECVLFPSFEDRCKLAGNLKGDASAPHGLNNINISGIRLRPNNGRQRVVKKEEYELTTRSRIFLHHGMNSGWSRWGPEANSPVISAQADAQRSVRLDVDSVSVSMLLGWASGNRIAGMVCREDIL